MQFKKMSIGNKSYGDIYNNNINDESKYLDDYGFITNININDNEIFNDLDNNNNELLDLFFTCLSTCHSGIIDNKKFDDEKKLFYETSSPDEIALLNCARFYKYIFTGKNIDNDISILDKNGNKKIFKELIQFEYSSERKRMSVILKCPDDKIRLFIKGADNIIIERLNKNNNPNLKYIEKKLLDYSHEGLRILMIAYKEIDNNDFRSIYKEYKKAQLNTYLKNKLLNILAEKVENNLILLGITGIEDKLQDNVDEVLESFITAGIKIWMLTGDKKETAKSIAYSCKLLNDEAFTIFDFSENSSKKTLTKEINNFIKIYNNSLTNLNQYQNQNEIKNQIQNEKENQKENKIEKEIENEISIVNTNIIKKPENQNIQNQKYGII
jgi:magnesium-transporting ATPase (P-type)